MAAVARLCQLKRRCCRQAEPLAPVRLAVSGVAVVVEVAEALAAALAAALALPRRVHLVR